MNLKEECIEGLYQVAKKDSVSGTVDEYYQAVLPGVLDCLANEIFLTQNRDCITDRLLASAYQTALLVPLKDVSEDDDAVLTIHYYMRTAILKLHGDSYFRQIVDQSTPIEPRFTKDTYYRAVNIPAFRWVLTDYRRSLHAATSEGKLGQIVFSLIERYKQSLFMKNCFDEFVQRVQGNVGKKYTFSLLTDSEKFTSERNEAYLWLQQMSHKIARGHIEDGEDALRGHIEDGEDALHDWSVKLQSMPFHMQMQKLGATSTAIRGNLYDRLKKGGKYKQVPLDDTLKNVIPDDTQEKPAELRELLVTEGIQRFKEKQQQIEYVLSEDAKRNHAEIGKRRWRVMELRIQTNKTAEEIGEMLDVSEKTVDTDWAEFQKKREVIQEILMGEKIKKNGS